jgi:aspartyl-tRNA(Asn)/glutamyl-tRNA(Gln) amidotransferase subunit C
MVDIEKLALLARIKLTPTEKEKLEKEFGDILDYVSQLQKADIRNVGDGENEEENVLREDKNSNEPGIFSEKLLKEAPYRERGYIKVKRILE